MINLAYLIFINLIRLIFNKIRYGKRYISSNIERISPGARLKLYGKSSIEIGRNIALEAGVDIQGHGEGKIKIGNRVYMNRFCMISCQEEVEIGDNCLFGPSVKIFDNNHRFYKDKGVVTDIKSAPIKIGNNCWLAANVIVLKGVTIGDNSIIAAGCIISKDIPSNSIVRNNQNLIIESLR